MKEYKGKICRGSWELNSNCKTCEKCKDTNPFKPAGVTAVDVPEVYNPNNHPMKHYFIYYEVYRIAWSPAEDSGTTGQSSSNSTVGYQDVINEHPLQWQLDANEKYAKPRKGDGDYTISETFKIISWNELTESEYEQFKGEIG